MSKLIKIVFVISLIIMFSYSCCYGIDLNTIAENSENAEANVADNTNVEENVVDNTATRK